MSGSRSPPEALPVTPGLPPGESASGPLTLANTRQCPTCSGRYPADFKVCPRDATPLEDARPDDGDPIVGQLLSGTYEVLRLIGEGGMGRVYEARHARLPNKRFAIKVLHRELARQPEVVTRFQREAEASSGLSHPNVISVFDVNTAPDGQPYIVAELLEGEQLGEFLDRSGKIGVAVMIPIARQICKALSRAHEQGIVHRDVKPENVFLLRGESGGVKVLDFGISKLSAQESKLTKTGMVMGTPDYMAPEQARGDRVDARADVYAVGTILYRALTGRKPFEGLDMLATLTAVLVQEPTRPSLLEPSLPIELEMVVQRAMAKEPRERFQTMAELDRALSAFDPEIAVLPVLANEKAVVGASGKNAVSQPGVAPPMALGEHSGNSARLARPTLLFFTGLGFSWLVVNVVVAVAAFIRHLRGTDLTASEAVIVPVGALGVAVTPAILWIRYLTREVWPSTPRAVEMGGRVRGTVLYSASAYGIGVLFVSLFEVLLQRNGEGVARPAWALMTFVLALTVAAAAWLRTRPRR